MSKHVDELAHFRVLDLDGENGLDTVVHSHMDTCSGYHLITITQHNDDGTEDCVCLSREQLASLAAQAKGH